MRKTNANEWRVLLGHFDNFLEETGAEATIIRWNSEIDGLEVLGSSALKEAITKKELNNISLNFEKITLKAIPSTSGAVSQVREDNLELESKNSDDSDNEDGAEQGEIQNGETTLAEVKEEMPTENTGMESTLIKSEAAAAVTQVELTGDQVNEEWKAGNKNAEKKKRKKRKAQPKVMTCDVCEKSFSGLASLKSHMKTHREVVKPHKCNICGKCFEYEPHCRRHTLSHTAGRSCKKCGGEFKDRKEYQRHYRLMHSSFVCDLCERSFTCGATLARHKRIHTGEKPFQCDECGKCFYEKGNLKKHQKTMHSGEPPVTCDVCGGIFKKRSLVLHMKRHSSERPFKCTICDKGFITKQYLEVHVRRHTGELPFICHQCGKGFTVQSNLRKHMVRHSEERPFSCTICGRTFSTHQGCKKHERSHSDEKPHTCPTCGRSFKYGYNLTVHKRSHNQKDQFTCDICFKGYCDKRSLLKHSKTHLGSFESKMLTQLGANIVQGIDASVQPLPTQSHMLPNTVDNSATVWNVLQDHYGKR